MHHRSLPCLTRQLIRAHIICLWEAEVLEEKVAAIKPQQVVLPCCICKCPRSVCFRKHECVEEVEEALAISNNLHLALCRRCIMDPAMSDPGTFNRGLPFGCMPLDAWLYLGLRCLWLWAHMLAETCSQDKHLMQHVAARSSIDCAWIQWMPCMPCLGKQMSLDAMSPCCILVTVARTSGPSWPSSLSGRWFQGLLMGREVTRQDAHVCLLIPAHQHHI